MKKSATFEIERETKNAVRYKEMPDNDLPPLMGIIYIQKSTFDGAPPKRLIVTITTAEN